MTIASVEFVSQALHRQVTYSAILPDKGEGPFPVLLQLHGAGDNHTVWIYRTKLPYYMLDTPMIVILPDCALSYYLNIDESQRYEDFLIQDLWSHVKRMFPARDGRWAIGGFSMGGYGAVRLGSKYPDRFASIWAHSGWYPTRDELMESHFNGIDYEDADVYWHTQRLRESSHHVTISLDCGVNDHLVEFNRKLHAHMEQIDLAHTYHEYPGYHNWDYCDAHIQEALRQHQTVFAAEK